ncbi:hypothetical protein [Actinoplanes sp. NBRC 103695]|uniref:hypothetical protein n=1 Tax=Actinoplanes sp. NBRC 103695 TaxID=3032202 RepID=UPI0024A1A438|nr:hypothetical protein [Actinoplanes sp. NBRC 103695]GLY93668.1 hypothetical protein Acsp02_09240 [Actinoplanes sp. NBRC 103695]
MRTSVSTARSGHAAAGIEELFGVGGQGVEVGAGRGGDAQHAAVEETDGRPPGSIGPQHNLGVAVAQFPPHVAGVEPAARRLGRRPLAQRTHGRADLGMGQALPHERGHGRTLAIMPNHREGFSKKPNRSRTWSAATLGGSSGRNHPPTYDIGLELI